MEHDLIELSLDVAEIETPVLAGPQCQGDVMWWPTTEAAASAQIPQEGAIVIRGENGGNTHTLLPGGFFEYRTGDEDPLKIGVLTVPPGGEVYMHHPEHGYNGIAPGTYRIGRQREWAGEWRMIAD